jgi:RNA polymerase-associated protein CTR9
MAHLENGHANGFGDAALTPEALPSATRFSDIPSAIDIPASTFDSEVEVSLEELPDDPTELCTLLENEKAAKNFWVIISLAYAKQKQLDHAVEILQKGLASVAHGATKEKLGLLNWLCWLLMLRSRQAPRVAPDGDSSDVKTKDYYLQLATSTLNEASRLNPAYTPLFLARGVLCLLRASLYPPKPVRAGIPDNSERVETLRQALKCFEEASKASGGRNVMAHLGLARAQYALGNYPDALLTYQTVLARMPGLTDPDPRIGIGCCLWQLDFKERARDAWERALSLVSNGQLACLFYFQDTNNISPARTRNRKLQIC